MPKLRHLHLEPYSLALARRILDAFPQWEPYCGRAEREEDGLRVNVLQIEVPSANPKAPQPLRIVAEPDRIVIAWWFPVSANDTWHVDWADYATFAPLPPALAWRDDPSGFDRIVAWLRGFVDEEHVATAWFHDGDWGASGNPTSDELEGLEGEFLVRSWRGTYDVDTRPERPLPPVILYGDPASFIGRLLAVHLASETHLRFATDFLLPLPDRGILFDREWSQTLAPDAAPDFGEATRPNSRSRPRLFVVRWDDEAWKAPWEAEGFFEMRDLSGDADRLKRELLAWLREP